MTLEDEENLIYDENKEIISNETESQSFIADLSLLSALAYNAYNNYLNSNINE
ncbi:hypothetical protein M2480_001794 [Parabacteroides sp. PFB2-12]|uniref:hypothetical protein n=1 Tax=unclassified Parabacteroides TaxID=2649774 RepID=UPI002472EAA5|nr:MULTISPECIES: hypothetical protein [unclassified Parabacteroides]MDH6343168.1 hypothetical protein [Parabacteroides sp. PM6-13]MDH6390812.1 hypothetical protein [Parabacteroides sp. PFB2-12]